MKIKSTSLYLIGAVLLIFGNRELWERIEKDKANLEKEKELTALNKQTLQEPFEVQKLKYDSVSGKWKNPEYYFQIINAGNPNFKALQKGIVKIETNSSENASDSQ